MSRIRRRKSAYIAMCALIIVASNCIAEFSSLKDRIRFSGFGTLGASYARSDDVIFRRNVSDPGGTENYELTLSSLSVIGLQANVSISHDLSVVLQATGRDRTEQT